MLKKARGALFRHNPLFFVLFSLSSTGVVAQVPDYDLDSWADGNFDHNAVPFFQALALQISRDQAPLFRSNQRLLVGGSATAVTSFGNDSIVLFGGKVGVFPAIHGSLKVTSNLALSGWYSGFSIHGDVIISSGYGLTFMFRSGETETENWFVTFRQQLIEGPDDFFLKTVGLGVIRRINYKTNEVWFGLASNHYNAGIHMNDLRTDSAISKRIKGQINTAIVGIGRSLGQTVTLMADIKLHPSLISFGIGISIGLG